MVQIPQYTPKRVSNGRYRRRGAKLGTALACSRGVTTPIKILDQIDANVDAFYRGDTGYLTFTTEQRRLWRLADEHGHTDAIAAVLRERGVRSYAAPFERAGACRDGLGGAR